MTVKVGVMELPAPTDPDMVRAYLNGTIADGGLWTALTRASNHDHTGGLSGAPISIASIPDGSITTSKLDPSVLLPYALVDGSKPFTGQVTMNADAIVRDAVYFGAPPAGVADVTLQRTAAGTLRLAGSLAMLEAQATSPASITFARFGQAAPDGLWLTHNAKYDGTAWAADDATKPASLFSMGNDGSFSFYGAPISATPVWAFKVSINTPLYALDVQSGDIMLRYGHAISMADAGFTISGGWKWAPGQGLGYIVNGAQTGTFFSQSDGSLAVKGTLTSVVGNEGLSGMWLCDAASARKSFVGLDGDPNTWRVFSNVAGSTGNKLSINLATGYVSIPGGLGVSGDIMVTGGIGGNGSVLNLSASGNIQLSPTGTYVHPSGNNTINMGHPGLLWKSVWTYRVDCASDLMIAATGAVRIAPTNNTVVTFENSANGVWPGIGDGVITLGRAGARWTSVWAANGAIQTCLTEEKTDFRSLDPEDALLAILRTPIQTYRAQPSGARRAAAERWPDAYGGPDPLLDDFRFVGFRAEAVDPLFLLDGDKHVSAQHTASVAVSGIQALYARIAKLEARLKEMAK